MFISRKKSAVSLFITSCLTLAGCAHSDKIIDVNTANPNLPSFVTFNDVTPDGKRWQKVEAMSDEFNEWDNKKWFKPLWNYGDTPVNMKAKNAGVSDGNLWIKATLDETNATRWFETSRVQSRGKIIYPVYVESRIKASNISAYNTFWLNNGNSENRDEIDIIENNANPSYRDPNGKWDYANYPWEMHSQYFIVKDSVVERGGDDNPSDNRSDLSAHNTLNNVKWNDAYHVFGAWWKDEHTVQFYLNGEAVNSVTSTQAFTLEQNIIWDLWTQDSAWVGGLPAKNDLLDNNNNTMYIDWVRTWQLVDK